MRKKKRIERKEEKEKLRKKKLTLSQERPSTITNNFHCAY